MLFLVLGGRADLMPSRMGTEFDVISCYEVAAELVIRSLLSSPRLERLVTQKQVDTNYVLNYLTTTVMKDWTQRRINEKRLVLSRHESSDHRVERNNRRCVG